MLLSLLGLIVGFFLLLLSSEFIVENAKKLSATTGVRKYNIGAFLIATMTSLPEAAVALNAGLAGDADIIVGTAFGSVAALLLFVLPVMAFRKEIEPREEQKEDIYLAVSLTVLCALLILILKSLSVILGLLLIGVYFAYGKASRMDVVFERSVGHESSRKLVAGIAIGIAVLLLGSKLLVKSVEEISAGLGVPVFAISFFLIALGTSLPELSVELAAVRKGTVGLALGDVFGSALADVSFVVGVGALAGGLMYGAIPITHSLLMPMAAVLFATAYLTYKMEKGERITWADGLVLLTMYLITIWLNAFT